MIDISLLRNIREAKIVVLGSHSGIIQSILDFDYLSGKKAPSVIAIIAGGRKVERYFFGTKEILIPVYTSLKEMPENIQSELVYFLNVNLSFTHDHIFEYLSNSNGHIFKNLFFFQCSYVLIFVLS